jgi:hypothetical protein
MLLAYSLVLMHVIWNEVRSKLGRLTQKLRLIIKESMPPCQMGIIALSSSCTDICCIYQISIAEGAISIEPAGRAEKATAYKTQGTRV